MRLSRKQSKGSIHSEKVGSRKQSRVSVHDHSDKGEDEQEIDLKQPRKQSEASVHSEKLASRKHSRVSTYDHSGKEDEKEDAEEGELPSSISISSISHMVSSVKPVSDNEETSSDKDEKHDSLPSGSVTVTIHKAKDLDGHWFDRGEFGKADPYAVVTIGKEKNKSNTEKEDFLFYL